METVLEMELPNIEDPFQYLLDSLYKGFKLYNTKPPIICMAPRVLRDENISSFQPRVVSIGPLHRKNKVLQEFEERKEAFMYARLDGFSNQAEVLRLCVQKVKDAINEVKEAFAGTEAYTDDQLIAMMVIDSCFILQFLDMDPSMFQDVLLYESIFYDLVLLENQIPFFVLKDIYECTINSQSESPVPLTKIILQKLVYILPFRKSYGREDDDKPRSDECNHILGLLHQSINLPSNIAEPAMFVAEGFARPFPSATNLRKSGVHFRRNYIGKPVLDMEFKTPRVTWLYRSKPILRMPRLLIGDKGERVLRNLIAFEMSGPRADRYITSYIYFMSMLVVSEEDVRVLVESRIIESYESYKYTFDLIQALTKGIVLEEFHYMKQWEETSSYYHRRFVSIRRTYFSGAWGYIAPISALILFILTAIQTFCAIRTL